MEAAHVERMITRYNDAWNSHDLDAITALHAPGIVFENHTAGERVEGAAAVAEPHRRDPLALARPRVSHPAPVRP